MIRATAASSTTAAASCASCRWTSGASWRNVRGAEVYQVLLTQDENERFAHSCTLPGMGELRRLQARLGHHARRGRAAAAPLRWAAADPCARTRCGASPPELSWKRKLRRIRDRVPVTDAPPPDSKFPCDRRIVYVVDLAATRLFQRGLVVDLTTQKRAPNGEWSSPKQFALREDQWADAPDPMDRQIAQMLTGAGSDARISGGLGYVSRDATISSRPRSARRCASCARADAAA